MKKLHERHNHGEMHQHRHKKKNVIQGKLSFWQRQGPTVLFWAFFLLYVAFILGSAWIFILTEAPEDERYRQQLTEKRRRFMENNPCVNEHELSDFMHEMVTSADRGVRIGANGAEIPTWTLPRSIMFTTALITTVGYGQNPPITDGGRAFAIVCAIIGLPLTVVAANILSNRILKLFLQFSKGETMFLRRLIQFVCVSAFLVVAFMLVPAIIFACMEPEWGFIDALYYSFMSMTTIGLGDYVIGQSINHPPTWKTDMYRISTSVYLVLCVSCAAAIIKLYSNLPEVNLSQYMISEPFPAMINNREARKVQDLAANVNPLNHHLPLFQKR